MEAAGCLRRARLGSSPQLLVGPESTTALMTAAVLAPMAAGDPAHYVASAAVLAVLVGAICFVAGIVRLGLLANLLWTGGHLVEAEANLARSPAYR